MNADATLRITEIFYSLQGEARTVGRPTAFIRLTGCPLRCVYCDTDYAFQGGTVVAIDDILRQVGEYTVGIHLYADVEATVTVQVVSEE